MPILNQVEGESGEKKDLIHPDMQGIGPVFLSYLLSYYRYAMRLAGFMEPSLT